MQGADEKAVTRRRKLSQHLKQQTNLVRSFLRSSTCKDSRIERRWGTVPVGDRVYLSGTHIGMGRGPTVASRNASSTPLKERGAAYS